MALKTITREEGNLTTWLQNQIALLEQQSGKKISILELKYESSGVGTEINLQFETIESA